MPPTGLRHQLLAVDPICALCDTPVTLIQGAPARQQLSAGVTVHRAFAWCRLWPCGHTFTTRPGAMAH